MDKNIELTHKRAIFADLCRKVANGDTALSDALMSNDKSMEKCYEYVRFLAKKCAKNGLAFVEDTIVYSWAYTYYTADNADIVQQMQPTITKDAVKEIADKLQDMVSALKSLGL